MFKHFRKTAFIAALGFVFTASNLFAEEILPPEQGKHSMTFVLPNTVPPFPTGAQIEFFVTDDKGIPSRLNIFGFALGMKRNVAFVEVSERDAVRLAFVREVKTVRAVKVADPDLDLVAERRKSSADREIVQVAPSMRMFKLRVPKETEGIENWVRGSVLVFRDPHRKDDPRIVAGQFFKYGNATATLLSRETVVDGYELMLLSDPSDAPEIMHAQAEGRLTLEFTGRVATAKPKEPKRCLVYRRDSDSVISIRIPCHDQARALP